MRVMSTRHRARGVRLLAAAALVAPLVAACGSGDGDEIIINLYNAPQQNLQTVVDNCNDAADGKYKIVYNKLPRTADGQREQLVRRLAAGDTSMDILGIDVVWTAEFGGAGWIKEWTGSDRAEVEDDALPGPLATAIYQDKMYAAPANTNVQLLWYRSDLVPTPPTTWAEMIDMAKQLKADGKPYQIGLTGAQYEGLVVAFNTMVASAGGEIIDESGTKAVIDDGAVEALELLKTFSTAGVTSPRLTNSFEDDVRLEMQNSDGDMAFELNWPYVYAGMKTENPEMFKNFKWTTYPAVNEGEPARVTVGGSNYAVSSYSQHPEEAFEATLCLRNKENQILEAVNDGVPPTIESAYDDPRMDEAYPMKDAILESLQTSSSRPVTPAYQNASTVMATVLSPPTAIDPERTAEELRQQLQNALDSKGVLP